MTKAVELTLGGALTVLVREIEQPTEIDCIVTLSFDSFTVTARGDIMFTLPNDKQVRVKVAYADAAGNPATVDNDPVWSSSDGTIAQVTADVDDAFEAVVVPVGPVGQAQISVKVDADIGEGERELVTLMDVEVVGGEAVAGMIEPVGGLEDKPVMDNTLPGDQPRVDNTLPGTPAAKPGSPGGPPRAGQQPAPQPAPKRR